METHLPKDTQHYLTIVLTVPMRNGNLITITMLSFEYVCSYRTYEEWKLVGIIATCITKYCSYRTYEEWKRP